MTMQDVADADVARLRGELLGTLARMQNGMETLTSKLPNHAAPGYALTFRVDAALEARLARFMRASGITNRAGALRYLLCMGLTREETRQACSRGQIR